MVVVKIIGGLGNQMFQYAFAKSLQAKRYQVKLDISEFEHYKLHGGYQLNFYNIDLDISTKLENNRFYKDNFFTKVLRKFGFDPSRKIKEKSLLFDSELLNIKDNNYIDGYFQSEIYFKNIRNILLEQFTINQNKSTYTFELERKIHNSKNSCSLHIRRGDFINDKNINIHGCCNLEYYKKAMQYLEEKIDDISYFVFSDDIAWCKENLNLINAIYVDSKEKRIPHEDIYLMSLCIYNIIANSSFSWWGAWLNQNKDKIVIAPKRWFADDELEKQSKNIVCQDWIKL